MSDEPTYPKDAVVGADAAQDAANEAASEETSAGSAGAKRKNYVKAGVAVGIGSAAIVAALLYANRGKRGGDQGEG
jgi:hypothetical protein